MRHEGLSASGHEASARFQLSPTQYGHREAGRIRGASRCRSAQPSPLRHSGSVWRASSERSSGVHPLEALQLGLHVKTRNPTIVHGGSAKTRIDVGCAESVAAEPPPGPAEQCQECESGRRMQRKITGFHTDEEEHWVAELECGHHQHVRHHPPWINRPWVITAEGRAHALGVELNCTKCDNGAAPDGRPS
jgi:hypothetical protein